MTEHARHALDYNDFITSHPVMADREELRKQRAIALQRKREQTEEQTREEIAKLEQNAGGFNSMMGGKVARCASSFGQGAFMGIFYHFCFTSYCRVILPLRMLWIIYFIYFITSLSSLEKINIPEHL